MNKLPDVISTEQELEAILSQPTDRLVAYMKELDGDIMILGAGGKVGPTMARLAKNAITAAGVRKDVYAVDVFDLPQLAAEGIKAIKCDMLNLAEVEKLPRVRNIIFMAGRKFGSTGSEHLTWAINVIVPYHVARTFTTSRIAAFSTGCVYPVAHVFSGGCVETEAADPVGEYAQSCLGRERMFDFFSQTTAEQVVQIRLNYAVDLRYGVLYDVGSKIWKGEPVDITTGFANVIWQGDACNQVIQALSIASKPAAILNVTGPEIFSIRKVALRFGELMGKKVTFTGQENGKAYLNNATKCCQLFGYPEVPLGKVVDWTAHWITKGGASLGKPTHFETQDGKY